MIVALVAVSFMQQTMVSDQPGGRLNIPPAMAGSVMPYVNCVGQRFNERLPLGSRDEARQALRDAVSACAELRDRGIQSADAALRRSGRYGDASARRSAVTSVFDQVERAYDPLIERLAAEEEPAAVEEK